MSVTYSHVLSFLSLSLSLSLCCVTADALMIREKVRISFARLIPEVSGREREREREKEREQRERSTRPKESEKEK